MTMRVWVGLLLCGLAVLPGCGDDSAGDADVTPDDADVQEEVSGPDADADADVDVEPDVEDVDSSDDGIADEGPDDVGDAEVDPCPPPVCGDDELCGESGQGDGMDNDCDTEVDETCSCDEPGTTLECFPGDPSICTPGLPCLGACVRGYQTCGTDNRWGPCEGATVPAAEVCDGMDNDCDDVFDEGISGCVPPIRCPRPLLATPMSWVWLDGGTMFPDAYDSWNWTITCPPTVTTCPAPEAPTSRETRIMFISSGTYRARATVVAGTATHSCEFAISVRGSGLRVELTWDTQGSAHGDTDLDVHLHKWGAETGFATADDCYYSNCKASTPEHVDWGLAPTVDLDACRYAPHGEGDQWVTLGSCYNPRLDVDMIYCESAVTDPMDLAFCAPENINVDNPPLLEPMRIMVNYFSEHGFTGTTNAAVNIFCGGGIRATLGPQPLTRGSATGEGNDVWLVADVMFYETECGQIECEVVPLSVVQLGYLFGPTWSTFSAAP